MSVGSMVMDSRPPSISFFTASSAPHADDACSRPVRDTLPTVPSSDSAMCGATQNT